MLDAVFLPFLSRQLNDCMCFLIYCTFFDYVQGNFKRMISISHSWWSQEGATENSCFNLAVHLFASCSNLLLYIKIMQNDYPHQYGVPMKVFLLPIVLSSWALTPKSTTRKEHWDKRLPVSQLACTILASLLRCLCARTRVLWHNFWGSLSYQA